MPEFSAEKGLCQRFYRIDPACKGQMTSRIPEKENGVKRNERPRCKQRGIKLVALQSSEGIKGYQTMV